MKVRCKSLWRRRNAKQYRKRANQRAAKERMRVERAARDEVMPEIPALGDRGLPKAKPRGFRVTITCLDDGERVSFTARRDMWGKLSVSPTLAGRKVAAVLANYKSVG